MTPSLDAGAAKEGAAEAGGSSEAGGAAGFSEETGSEEMEEFDGVEAVSGGSGSGCWDEVGGVFSLSSSKSITVGGGFCSMGAMR